MGLFGSLHCLGMCGPIALALPIGKGKTLAALVPGRVLYNAGRLLSYMIIGAIFGLLGQALVLAGFQQKLSIIAGVLLIIIALAGFFSLSKGKSIVNRWMVKIFNGRFKSDTPGAMLSIGVLNGFLPCGLVYAAGTASVSSGSLIEGSLFMLFFGLGTYPLMLAVSLSPAFLSAKKRLKIKNLSPYIALVIGVLFVLRGSNLDIPYVSPKVDLEKETMECCEPTKVGETGNR